ncbi:MAG TPA: hypothetical protein VN258_03720 [Mobilitalea sp.]|nr:hypothetical protein [Mobilitalea sp.]
MKKFGKFIFGTVAVASVAAGAYYLYKTYIKKDSTDDFDDFEDDFEDFDTDEDSEAESREYVTINMVPENTSTEASKEFISLDKQIVEDDEDEQ